MSLRRWTPFRLRKASGQWKLARQTSEEVWSRSKCGLGGMALSRGQQSLGVALMAVGVIALIAVALASSVLEIIARTGLYIQAVDDKVLRKFERQLDGE